MQECMFGDVWTLGRFSFGTFSLLGGPFRGHSATLLQNFPLPVKSNPRGRISLKGCLCCLLDLFTVNLN